MPDRSWDVDELVARAAVALRTAARDGEYEGPPNARVRDLPDRRSVRWYASTGLVDRPAGGRGRAASYSERHLAQLVAVKRLQARGWSLAEIQARLLGAPDDELLDLAGLPPEALAAELVVPAGHAPASGSPRPGPLTPLLSGSPPAATGPPVRPGARPFWAVPTAPASAEPAAPSAASVEEVHGLRLADGVVLLLPVRPGPDELPGLIEAAAPLLIHLREHGLVAPDPAASPPHRPHGRSDR